MRWCLWWPSLMGTLLLGVRSHANYPAPPTPPIEKLIRQLGSQHFPQRAQASKALGALGPSALPRLRQALSNPDAEIRRRARILVNRLQRQADTAQALQPSRIRLVYNNVPLAEAVEDLARRTGFPIQLHRSKNLRSRRITLHTKEHDFWTALERFKKVARLRERPVPRPVSTPHTLLNLKGRRIAIYSGASDKDLHKDTRLPIVLQSGTPRPSPTVYNGALRLRLLVDRASTGPEGSLAFSLEVTPEPHLGWQRVVALDVLRAVDNHGQELPSIGSYPATTTGTETDSTTLPVWDGTGSLPINKGERRLPIQLRRGPKPSRQLRELHGRLSAWVSLPPEPMVCVKRILTNTGAFVEEKGGTQLKVSAIRDLGDGEYDLRVEVTSTEGDELAVPGARLVLGRARQGKTLLSERSGTSPFALLDNNGKPLYLASGQYVSEGPNKKLYSLFYLARKGQGAPRKLVYHGRRKVLISVPFTFRNVPLRPADHIDPTQR